MHFKDFTDQFYQYPHQLSYSKLLKSHNISSFECVRKFSENHKQVQTISNTRKRKTHGKMFNIFTQLRKKTSSEIENFLDIYSESQENSSFSVCNETIPNETLFHAYSAIIPNEGNISKSIQVTNVVGNENIQGKSSKQILVINPELQIHVKPSEFDTNDKSLNYNIYHIEENLENYPYKENDKDEVFQPQSTDMIRQDGRMMEVYNAMRKVFSNVKWRSKKFCGHKTSYDTTLESNTPTTDDTNKAFADKSTGISTNSYPCTCEQHNKNGSCNCWNKEDETLFCLLKLEARENFKQIKHMERELKIQRKALKILNTRCTGFENAVQNITTEKPENVSVKNSNVQEIFTKSPTLENQTPHDSRLKPNDVLTQTDPHPAIPCKSIEFAMDQIHKEFEEIPAKTSKPRINDVTKDASTNKSMSNHIVKADVATFRSDEFVNDSESRARESVNTKPGQLVKFKPEQDISFSQSIATSKVKITISRSKIVINTSSENVTDSARVEKTNDYTLSTIEISNINEIDNNSYSNITSCHCIEPPAQTINSPPPKKSRRRCKFFRIKKRDLCECCATTSSHHK